jgi:hypothetical protein
MRHEVLEMKDREGAGVRSPDHVTEISEGEGPGGGGLQGVSRTWVIHDRYGRSDSWFHKIQNKRLSPRV